jgi:hypothetical protein
MYQPVGPLGWIWRFYDSRSGPPLRNTIGWATAPQVETRTDFQCDWSELNPLLGMSTFYSDCWLLRPDGQVLLISQTVREDGTTPFIWQVWAGP